LGFTRGLDAKIAAEDRNLAKFPVNFPVHGKFAAETGSRLTASSATQSGLHQPLADDRRCYRRKGKKSPRTLRKTAGLSLRLLAGTTWPSRSRNRALGPSPLEAALAKTPEASLAICQQLRLRLRGTIQGPLHFSDQIFSASRFGSCRSLRSCPSPAQPNRFEVLGKPPTL
jgi:hypothetical protein